LILAVSPEEAQRLLADAAVNVPLTRIGKFIDEPGLWGLDEQGQRRALAPRGYRH
jgi:hypothetical protein